MPALSQETKDKISATKQAQSAGRSPLATYLLKAPAEEMAAFRAAAEKAGKAFAEWVREQLRKAL